MSAKEFSAALKNRALNTWFKNELEGGGSASKAAREQYSLDNVNVLANPVGLYRSGEQTSEKTAFIITKDTIRDLIVQFHEITDTKVLSDLTDTYFTAFRSKNVGAVVSRKKITVGDGIPAIYFPNISFKTITDLVNNIMNLKAGDLAAYYEKGHVVGLATELLQVTTNRIRAVDTTGSTGKAFLLNQLDKVIDYYKRLDLDSANIQPAKDVKVYASVNKSINKLGTSRYLVELQTKDSNQKSAKEVQKTIGSIRKLLSPGTLSEKAIKDLIDKIKESVTDPKFQEDLAEMRSSPSYKEMIANNLIGILKGVPVDQSFNHKDVYITSAPIPKVDLTKVKSEIKKEIAKAEAAKRSLASKGLPLRNTKGRYTSLASIQVMLDQNITEQVKSNMGTGDRKDVLNYQTGRFAESVKIERLTQSREGMISVYYNYMRNPYGTFSVGGQQSIPQTRDPKTLISKSIREIGAKLVSNRMRAVLI